MSDKKKFEKKPYMFQKISLKNINFIFYRKANKFLYTLIICLYTSHKKNKFKKKKTRHGFIFFNWKIQ